MHFVTSMKATPDLLHYSKITQREADNSVSTGNTSKEILEVTNVIIILNESTFFKISNPTKFQFV